MQCGKVTLVEVKCLRVAHCYESRWGVQYPGIDLSYVTTGPHSSPGRESCPLEGSDSVTRNANQIEFTFSVIDFRRFKVVPKFAL